jgi:AcrR family transcriptional regulator
MVKTTEARMSPRDKLLAAASELFYEDGVHTVGIDRIIEHAGVSKGSLYNTFGSKDELIRAYLMARHERTMERMTRELAARFDSRPRPTDRRVRRAGHVIHRAKFQRLRIHPRWRRVDTR